MIINIRGTSGSGKTHLVNRIIGEHKHIVPYNVPKRKNPLAYRLYRNTTGDAPVGLLGHYESPCGGCDTISGYDNIFDLVFDMAIGCKHVVFEGLLLSEEHRRTNELIKVFGVDQVMVVLLDTRIEECIRSINSRRWERDPTLDPVNPKNTTNRVRTIERAVAKLPQECVYHFSRDMAFDAIMGEL